VVFVAEDQRVTRWPKGLASCVEIRSVSHRAFDPRALLAWHAQARRAEIDIFHAPYHVWAPIALPCPLVATVHDLTFDRHPRVMPNCWLWPGYKVLSSRAIRCADKIISVSEATRRDVLRFGNVSSSSVVVVHLGVDEQFKAQADVEARRRVADRYHLPPRYVLAFNNGRAHKNVARLLAAFEALPRSFDQVLVLAGEASGENVRRGGLARSDRFLPIGLVDEEDLPAVYASADAFIQPSFAEGFGLTVAEAMACGCPVLCSGVGSLPEVADGAARLFNPFSVASITDALTQVLGDDALRRAYATKGLARAASLTWDRTAACTRQIYETVARSGPGAKSRS
jgi:alpha-1,3-rhamnosyl/mannosyltransferase